MMRRVRPRRPASITTAPESPSEELARRQRRYAVMAAVFIVSFAAAAILHRFTVVALLLSGVAMTTLVVSVIGANVRSPRRRRTDRVVVPGHKQLPSTAAKRPPGR